MNLFQTIHSTVTARQAAERYGLSITPSGFASCPFHHDKTPSMKVDQTFWCFACGEHGDAIDLTAKLFNLTPQKAALKLAADFNIDVLDESPGHFYHRRAPNVQARASPDQGKTTWRDHAIDTSIKYRWLLRDWERSYEPREMTDEWHPLFCEALLRKTRIDDLLDELICCSVDQFEEIKKCCGKEIEQIENRLEQYAGRDASGNQEGKNIAETGYQEETDADEGKLSDGTGE